MSYQATQNPFSLKSFTVEALKSFKNSGTIKPSSKHLVNLMLADVDFSQDIVIVEYGTGDGVITAEILKRMTKKSKLIAFEINDLFYEHCKAKFSSHKNFSLYSDSAESLPKILLEHQISKVDFILSSLPLSIMDDEVVDTIIDTSVHLLDKNGALIQYMYSFKKLKYFKSKFKKVNIDFTVLNVPPAVVFTCLV